MRDEAPPRRGLEPVPGRVPRLPGAGARPVESLPVGTPAPPREIPRAPAPPASAGDGRAVRPREFQLDKEPRDYLDTTAFAIRLRTEAAFDRSALLRGLVKAVLRSGLDVASRCDSEEDVIAYLLQHLPPRPA